MVGRIIGFDDYNVFKLIRIPELQSTVQRRAQPRLHVILLQRVHRAEVVRTMELFERSTLVNGNASSFVSGPSVLASNTRYPCADHEHPTLPLHRVGLIDKALYHDQFPSAEVLPVSRDEIVTVFHPCSYAATYHIGRADLHVS